MGRSHAVCVGLSVAAATGLIFWALRPRRTGAKPPDPPVTAVRTVKPPTDENNAQPSPAATGSNRRVAVVFGSASGTGELLAKGLAAEARVQGFDVQLFDAYNLRGKNLESVATAGSAAQLQVALDTLLEDCRTIVFIVSTHGEGDPPDAAAPLLAALETQAKKAASGNRPLAAGKVPFAHTTFALGDSSYKYYCRGGSRFDTAFTRLGSRTLHSLGKGDARGDMEGAFDEWREALWPKLAAAAETTLAGPAADAVPQPEHAFAFRDDLEPAASPFAPKASALEPSQHTPFHATVSEVEPLVAPAHVESGRVKAFASIVIDVRGSAMAYQAGDHLGVLPRNPDAAGERVCDALGVPAADRDRVVELCTSNRLQKRASPANVLPARVTLREALRWYVDLCGQPRRSTVRTLGRYSPSETEKAALGAAVASTEAFAAFCEAHRDVCAVLEAFPGAAAAIPIGHLLEILPRIAPRYFSIASDSTVMPQSVRICVVESEGGLLSPFLARQVAPGDKLFIFIRHAGFNLPLTRKTAPIVMVGAGSGVAPYVGFCERRKVWMAKAQKPLGPALLFFGCRHEDGDYLYRERLEEWNRDGVVEVVPAFSRDGAKKVYVQNRVAEHAERIHELLEKERAVLYICGDARHMAKDVEEVLITEVYMRAGGLSRAAAESAIAGLEKNKRLLKDVWTG